MRIIKASLLAATTIIAMAGSAEAQTKYYAREILVPGTGGPTAQDPEPTTPPVQQPTVYNQFDGPSAKSVIFNDNCSFSTVDAASPSSAKFTTVGAAKDWCTTIKVKYPSTKSMYMMCTVQIYGGYYISAASSGTCAHTLSGGAVGSDGVGRYSMVAIPSAY